VENLILGASRSGAKSRDLQWHRFSQARRPAFLQSAVLLFAGFLSLNALRAQNATAPYSVITTAGIAGSAGSTDGTGSAATFANPSDVAVDTADNIYIADTANNTVRKVAFPIDEPYVVLGVVTTLAGQAGVSGSSDGPGTAASFNHPAGVAVDSFGNVYVADTDNNEIRKVTAAGVVSTLAGLAGRTGSVDGSGSAASFNGPSGIVADLAGDLYVADTLNHTIRKVTSAGVVTTIAGTAGTSGIVDGTGSAAQFHGPQGLALDVWGNLFVADTNNNVIRKVATASGAVTTLAGQPGVAGSADGTAVQAQFRYPSGIAVDAAGTLIVADTDNHALREVTASGGVTTLAGLAGFSGSTDGTGTAARFNFPTGVAFNSTGSLFIADTDNDTLRLAYLPALPVITQQPQDVGVVIGGTATFSVTATGGPFLGYSWNATTKEGYLTATRTVGSARTLTINNVQNNNAGTYSCTVSNFSGTVTSSYVELVVPTNTGSQPSSGGGGSGGGGAPSVWFCGMLSLLALARRAWVASHRR
jgi:sugar lactone lactonase YvrE